VSKATPPNVYTFTDYRKFLAAHYAHQKAHQYGFSFRVFSKRAGLRSSNYVGLVIDGKRNLTREMAGRFALACELGSAQTDFFCELVEYNQAKTNTERNRIYERLARFRPFREARRLDGAQAEYHSSWYVPAIRELVRRADFDEDPKWIARQLTPTISTSQAKKAIELLGELGLVKRDDSGRLAQTTPLVTTGPGPLGHHIVNFHHSMIERAQGALDAMPREERDISCLTLCVSRDKVDELKARLRAFRQELLRTAELDDQPERVVQINFQLFPLSIVPDGAEAIHPAPAAGDPPARASDKPRRKAPTRSRSTAQ
jgi:uncharacterized protein (TIGR02147 family)